MGPIQNKSVRGGGRGEGGVGWPAVRTGGTPAGGEGRKASQNSPSFQRGNQSGRRGSEEPVQSINQKVVQNQDVRYRYHFQSCGSGYGSGSKISSETDPDPGLYPGYDYQKLKKKKFCRNFFKSFFDQKLQSRSKIPTWLTLSPV